MLVQSANLISQYLHSHSAHPLFLIASYPPTLFAHPPSPPNTECSLSGILIHTIILGDCPYVDPVSMIAGRHHCVCLRWLTGASSDTGMVKVHTHDLSFPLDHAGLGERSSAWGELVSQLIKQTHNSVFITTARTEVYLTDTQKFTSISLRNSSLQTEG